jgi:transcriptional regulator NrdR family protein
MSEKPKGLHCPACGKRSFKTIDSRPTRGGVKRRKQCTSCDFRVTTIETIHHTSAPIRQPRALADICD